FFFSGRRWHASFSRDWSSAVCSSDLPEERYPGAIALADDLARFVVGEPIAARPPGLGARLSKWRRRRPVLAPLLLVLPLIGALEVGRASCRDRVEQFSFGVSWFLLVD